MPKSHGGNGPHVVLFLTASSGLAPAEHRHAAAGG